RPPRPPGPAARPRPSPWPPPQMRERAGPGDAGAAGRRRPAPGRPRAPRSAGYEQRLPGRVDEVGAQRRPLATRARHVDQPLQEVARMVAPQWPASVEALHHLQGPRLRRQPESRPLTFEDLDV